MTIKKPFGDNRYKRGGRIFLQLTVYILVVTITCTIYNIHFSQSLAGVVRISIATTTTACCRIDTAPENNDTAIFTYYT